MNKESSIFAIGAIAAGLATAALAAGCHGHSATEPVTTAPPPPAEPGPVGIETIREADIAAHVQTLASDDYLGRETNQPGERKAAAYLAAELAKYGLSPMPGTSGYQVSYQLEESGFDPEGTAATLEVDGAKLVLAPGTDFAPFFFSEEGEATAEVVFAGYGISAPDLGHDDYAGLDVAGKLVLVLRHAPGEKDEDSKLMAYSPFRTKAMEAMKRGAIGMLLVTDPLHHQGGDDLRLGGRLSLPEKDLDPALVARRKAMQERAEAAAKARGKAGKARGPFLALHVSQEAAGKIVAPIGTSLVDMQKAIDGGTKAAELPLKKVKATVRVTARKEAVPVTAHNVIGYLPGSDPDHADEWIVIGAHYDHLGAFAGEGDTVYNGADDNASGTTGMLELAQAFASLPTRPKRSLLFVGFSGEEKGLLGSRAAVAQGVIPADKVVFMLNLDMIGRNEDKPVAVVGDGYATGLSELITAESGALGINVELGGTDYAANSDHHSFFAESIPVLFFFTGLHDDYHQLSDHADKVATANMERIIKLAYRVVDRVASAEVTPSFIHHVTWLGIAVEVRGTDAVVTAVEPESRAVKAGFAVGDVITGLAGEALAKADDIGDRFAALEPGTSAPIAVRRGAETVELQVERAKRGYLGVIPRGIEDEERKKLGLGDDEGVLIAGLADDGPAGKAGIQKDDILIRIAGHPVGLRTLGRQLARIGAGEKVDIVVVRGGERVKLVLVLGAYPERP